MKKVIVILMAIVVVSFCVPAMASVHKAEESDGWVIENGVNINPNRSNPYLEVAWSGVFNEWQAVRLVGDIHGLDATKEFDSRRASFNKIKDALVAANATSGVVKVYLADEGYKINLYGKNVATAELVKHYLR